MKQLLKILAVISAVVLVGGLIWFRSGGGLFPSTKSGRIVPTDSEEQRAVLPGSKSDVIVSSPRVPETEREREMTIMPGSKSMSPVIEPDTPISADDGDDENRSKKP